MVDKASFNRIFTDFNVSGSSSSSGASSGSNFVNSIFTQGDGSSTASSGVKEEVAKKGLKHLLSLAKKFLASIFTNKTAAATATAAENTAEGVELAGKTATQLSELKSTAESLMTEVGENIAVLNDLIKQITELSEEVQSLNEQLEMLKEQAEQTQEALEAAETPEEKEALVAQLQGYLTQIQGITDRLNEIQETISDLSEQLTELQKNVAEKNEETEVMVSEQTEAIKEEVADNTKLAAKGTEEQVAGTTDAALTATGEGLSAGLHTAAAGATATVIGAGVGAAAEAAALETGYKAADTGVASGIEFGDFVRVVAQVAQVGSEIALNSGTLNAKQEDIAGTIGYFASNVANYGSAEESGIEGIGSAGTLAQGMITSIGSAIVQYANRKDLS